MLFGYARCGRWCEDVLFGKHVDGVAGVSVALISCWQAEERAVSPHSSTPGRKPV